MFAVDVELEEEGLGGGRGFDDGLEGVGGVARDLGVLAEGGRLEEGVTYALNDALVGGTSTECDLAVGVDELCHGSW